MLICPMCKKKLRGVERECGNCRTDVSLLVQYVENLQAGLAQAEAYTRAGELGEAVWAYLAVLEVDPDNATARRQVGKVATAVRQFDEIAPGRRWLTKLKRQTRFRRWLASVQEGESGGWIGWVLLFLLFLGVLFIGILIGMYSNPPATPQPEPKDEKKKEARRLYEPPHLARRPA
jgi:hypothetical protein